LPLVRAASIAQSSGLATASGNLGGGGAGAGDGSFAGSRDAIGGCAAAGSERTCSVDRVQPALSSAPARITTIERMSAE
jgi:hypothetical protein